MDENRSNEGKLGDLLKKVLTTGVTAAFMTEEAARAMLKDLPLPKEIVSGLIENAKTTKSDFVAGVKTELRSYLDKIDISREFDKIAEKYDFEVKATISLKKKNKKDKDIA